MREGVKRILWMAPTITLAALYLYFDNLGLRKQLAEAEKLNVRAHKIAADRIDSLDKRVILNREEADARFDDKAKRITLIESQLAEMRKPAP